MTHTVIVGPEYIEEAAQKSEAATPLTLWHARSFDGTKANRTRKQPHLRSRELDELRSQTELVWEGSSASSLSWFAFDIEGDEVSTRTFLSAILCYDLALKSWSTRTTAWAERYRQSRVLLTQAEEELYYGDELLDVMDVD